MCSDAPTAGIVSEDRARAAAEYFVRATATGGTPNILHLPGSDATADDPEPRCTITRRKQDTTWVAKPVAAYPPGYFPICQACRRDLTVDTGSPAP